MTGVDVLLHGWENPVRKNLDDHVTDGGPCWCGPVYECALCGSVSPCIHGPDRIEVIIHKEAS